MKSGIKKIILAFVLILLILVFSTDVYSTDKCNSTSYEVISDVTISVKWDTSGVTITTYWDKVPGVVYYDFCLYSKSDKELKILGHVVQSESPEYTFNLPKSGNYVIYVRGVKLKGNG